MTVLLLLLIFQNPAGEQARSSPIQQRFEYEEPHMGTVFRLQLYAADKATADRAARAGFDRVKQLNAIFSDYQADTELMQLCQKSGKGPVAVSQDLFDILQHSLDWSARSDGAFDVSIGPLVQLWRRARRTRELPKPDAIAAARNLVDFRSVVLNHRTREVNLKKHGMRLDLGGIAKGYTADEVQKVLKNHGIQSACVAAGGDVCVSQRPPGSEGWIIAIAPLERNASITTRLILENQAVSTAGDLEQFVEINGKRYSHIVDPKTGLGLIGRRSCTIVAARGVDSDGADTAAYIMGPARGVDMINQQQGMFCLFLDNEEGKVKPIRSKNWDSLRRN